MGRRPLDGAEKKEKILSIRMSEDEWCDIYQAAELEGLSMSAYIRKIVLQEAERAIQYHTHQTSNGFWR